MATESIVLDRRTGAEISSETAHDRLFVPHDDSPGSSGCCGRPDVAIRQVLDLPRDWGASEDRDHLPQYLG